MVWSYVKGCAARQYELGRSIHPLTQQTKDGFYGNSATSHQGVSSDLCKRLINNCHGWCNQFIQDDNELNGVVDSLELNENDNEDEIDIDEDTIMIWIPVQANRVMTSVRLSSINYPLTHTIDMV